MIRRAMAGTLGLIFSWRRIKENAALGLHSHPQARQWKNILFHSDGRGLRGTVLAAVHECPLFSRMGPKDTTYAVAAEPAPSTFYSGSAACCFYYEAFAEKVPVCAPCHAQGSRRRERCGRNVLRYYSSSTLPFLEAAAGRADTMRAYVAKIYLCISSALCPLVSQGGPLANGCSRCPR